MAKDRKKLQHIHSSVPDKQPTPATLEVGEIAVNNAKDQEFLSIKNSEDKVVRFSSDEQIVTIMERKEVMPYEGYVRGEDGPTGATGTNSVTNNDLLQNKSNIIIKLNQVAADNTVKHDVVNGAEDIYGNLVNPTADSGLTDGAGFAIDMSRYAMIDANPSFSSLTVTVQTDLSGNTTISNGAGVNEYGTDTGHTLTIETTDVVANDTNWTETITNKVEKITNNNTTIGTNVETISGNTTLTVSGTTTETKKGNVTETNLADKQESTSGNSYNDVKVNYSGTTGGTTTEVKVGSVTENTSGTTTIDRKGDVSENNQNNVTLVTSGATTETKIGNVTENHSGTTTETKKGNVTENNLANKTENITGNFIGNITGTTSETKIGNVLENHSGTTTEFKKGDVTENNLENKTENTTGNLSANTTGNVVENTTGTTTIDRVGAVSENNRNSVTVVTSGNSTTTVSGNIVSNTSGTTTETKKGNVVENNQANKTENTTGTVSNNTTGTTTENLSSKWTVNVTGGTELNSCDFVYVNTNDYQLKQCEGEEGTAEFDFCGGFTVDSDKILLQQCGNNGDITIKEKTVNLSGDTVNVTGGTKVVINSPQTHITGNTYLSGTTYIGDQCSQLTSTTIATSFCEVFDRSKVTMTRVVDPADTRLSAIYRLWQDGSQIGHDINVPKDGFLKDVELVNVDNVYYLRFTWNIYDSDTGTYRTGTTDVNVEDLVKDIEANNSNTGRGVDINVWYNATTKKMNVSGDTTVVIKNADGTGTKTFTKSNATNSLNSYTLNSTSGDVKSTAANTNWTYDPFDSKKNIVVPTDASHINRKTVSWTYGSVTGATGASYDPGDGTVNTTGTSRTMSFVIPKALKDLNNNLSNLNFNTGTTSVTGSPYNGSTEKTITIPSDASHITRKTLTVTHNGLTSSYDPGAASNTTMTLPHSSLTATYEATSGKTGSVTYNTSSAQSISIPTCVNHLNRHMIKFQSGSTASFNNQTYDPGKDCANTAETINIPTSIEHIKEWSQNCFTINNNLCVTGNITATGSVFSTSDERKKESINFIDADDKLKVRNIPLKSFNFKEDNTKRKVYGVIAQEVEAAGLDELVHTDEEGMKSVDYTSFLILRIAYLEKLIGHMHTMIVQLEEKIDKK